MPVASSYGHQDRGQTALVVVLVVDDGGRVGSRAGQEAGLNSGSFVVLHSSVVAIPSPDSPVMYLTGKYVWFVWMTGELLR
jgi:hypothetical protein